MIVTGSYHNRKLLQPELIVRFRSVLVPITSGSDHFRLRSFPVTVISDSDQSRFRSVPVPIISLVTVISGSDHFRLRSVPVPIPSGSDHFRFRSLRFRSFPVTFISRLWIMETVTFPSIYLLIWSFRTQQINHL